MSLLIVNIVPAGSPVRFTCLCFSTMRSCSLYSIVGLAWHIVSGELFILRLALTLWVVDKIRIRLLKHIIKMKIMKLLKIIVQIVCTLKQTFYNIICVI